MFGEKVSILRRLLIVDDQSGIRLLLQEVFKQEAYEVSLAANGLTALQKIEENQPDCVLLDLKMPGMDGVEVLERMKKSWPDIPVIMMTAYGELELTNKALELGAVKYFTKPFDIYEIRDAVNVLFES